MKMKNGFRDDFRSEFEKEKKRFNVVWNLIMGFIAVIFFVVISLWIVGLIAGVKVFSEVQNDDFPGAKHYIERLWCGVDGCKE